MQAFDLIAIVYATFAAGLAVRMYRQGRRTFDDDFRPEDRRTLGAAAFYFAIPVAVALHELGHAAVIRAFGAGISDWHYVFYWAYVSPDRALPPLQSALVALSGNVVSLLLAWGAVLWTLRRPKNAALNYVRLEFARIQLWIALVIYPVFSLLIRGGDFWLIREELDALLPFAGEAFLFLWAGLAFWTWRRWRGPWRRTFVWLATPLHDRLRAARARVEADPQSAEARRELGRVYLAGDEPERALGALLPGVARHPEEPELRFLAGFAHLRRGEAQQASEQLRAAGQMLEAEDPVGSRAELYYEVTLGLAAARLALGDPEGALLTAEAARERRPRDPRGLLVYADALVAAGRFEEARTRLSQALEDAEGVFRKEIRRRLATLSR